MQEYMKLKSGVQWYFMMLISVTLLTNSVKFYDIIIMKTMKMVKFRKKLVQVCDLNGLKNPTFGL